VRFREQQNVEVTLALLALGDALPPAAMASFPERAPISTVTWSIDLFDRPGDVDGWHLLRSTSEQTQYGYSTQTMDLWDASGRHLAAGRQLIAIFI
jgi:acyl-CoA thioesterase